LLSTLRFCAVLALLFLLGSPALAREISVRPGESLRAAVHQARAGDVVKVAAGTYSESVLYLPSGIQLISADGPGKARLDGGGHGDVLALYGRRDVVVDGFELCNAGMNIVKIEGCHNITLRHCKIHDTADGDCVKVTVNCQLITIEECEIYNPGHNEEQYEQNIDFIDTEAGVVRRCLLYHVGGRGAMIGFFKGGSRGCIFEQNVVLDAGGAADSPPAWALGQETDSEYKRGDYECVDSIIRDNLFLNCRSGAIGFYGCKGGYAYGNTLINSGPAVTFNPAGNSISPAIDQVFLFNNAILNPKGDLNHFFQGRQNMEGKLAHDYNRIWNGGKKLPGDLKEAHLLGTAAGALPAAEAGPSEGYAALAARFAGLAPGEGNLLALLPKAAQPPVPVAAAPPPAPAPPVTSIAGGPSPRVLAPPDASPEPEPETLATEGSRDAEAPPTLRPERPAPVRTARKPAPARRPGTKLTALRSQRRVARSTNALRRARRAVRTAHK
jgi:hypothetical protein